MADVRKRAAFKIPAGTIVRAVATWMDEDGNEKTHKIRIRDYRLKVKAGHAVQIFLWGFPDFPAEEDRKIGQDAGAISGDRVDRRFKTYIHKGVGLTLQQWAARTGIKLSTLEARLYRYKWSLERALTTKPRVRQKKGWSKERKMVTK